MVQVAALPHRTAAPASPHRLPGRPVSARPASSRAPTVPERAHFQASTPLLRHLRLKRVDLSIGSGQAGGRSEEHTSELQSLMRISYAVFCLKKKNKK